MKRFKTYIQMYAFSYFLSAQNASYSNYFYHFLLQIICPWCLLRDIWDASVVQMCELGAGNQDWNIEMVLTPPVIVEINQTNAAVIDNKWMLWRCLSSNYRQLNELHFSFRLIIQNVWLFSLIIGYTLFWLHNFKMSK